ncbi:MAG: EAL domain-containing protein, partial [Kangiellaceae bacterium]|nr:EAL domain-containing protein [Kangiellaceae bacterium]
GLVSPIQFIPVLEDTGLITEVGEWIFIQAAQQANKLRQTFDSDFQISVNASPIQFHNQSVIDWIDLLNGMSISPHVVAIEITENTLMETTRVVSEHLLRLRDNGFQVSLDDFGTGYSSLAYLKKFDIDFIKIDQSFVRNLSTHSSDLALCEAIIVMSHKLGLKVIAEGVENEEQMNLLSDAGCDYGQGYFFSKPVDSESFEQFLLEFDAQNAPSEKMMQS